ncbi:hypothetical protein [Streptomyces sp. NPDC029674]|uniref:hypothetical protein n=1 Tax=Streptomyces sp. NPDC029674 TaxID=3365297 RepID=UPI00384F3CAD
MEHSQHTPGVAWLTEAAKAAEQQGPGNLLRIVLIVMVVGCVLVGWFLLRGYRQGAERTPPESTEESTEESTRGTTDKGADDRNG